MATCDTREKVLELEQLVVAGYKGNCLNKISGGGGIKHISKETFVTEQGDNILENALLRISGTYDLSGIKRLLSMDITIQKVPLDKELKRVLSRISSI